MSTDIMTEIEKDFLSLPREEREIIIRHGVAFRLSGLRKRLFLAESKIRDFEEKYKSTLDQLDMKGLPNGAGYEMHEDYIMWHHWQTMSRKVKQDIESIQKIAQYGLDQGELPDVGE
jgi:hypothetical protein